MITKAQYAHSYRTLPSTLRRLRHDAGLTQRDLGDRLDRPQSWVQNCETGNRRIDLAEFCLWCEACGVDPVAGLRQYLKARG